MATHDSQAHNLREDLVSAPGERLPQAPQGQPYEAPELHEIGDLGKLNHYGFKYNDGYRYKDDY
jgi:hypothetical protein